MGLKNKLKKLVSDSLRPWLACDVFPIIHFSTSGFTLQLPQLNFDVDALNAAGMQSSPLMVKEAMKVENLQLVFTPFRQPMLALRVQGWHLVLEPRSAGDSYWGKTREMAAEQKEAMTLFALDPQGATAHAAAESLAEEGSGSSWIARFVMSLMLSSVRMECYDVSVKIVSHPDNGRQHVCTIPLSSLEIGEAIEDDGSRGSGGLVNAFTTTLRGRGKKKGPPTSKFCIAQGFGMQVGTLSLEGSNVDENGSDGEHVVQERAAAEVEDIAQQYLSRNSSSGSGGMMTTYAAAAPDMASKQAGAHIVLLQDLVIGFKFEELALATLEFDVPEAAFGFDFEEIYSVQILIAQIQGPADPPMEGGDTSQSQVESGQEVRGGPSAAGRSAKELWKRGIQKVLEQSPGRRIKYVLQAGISRRRYAKLYESWLLELGWGRGQTTNKRYYNKSHLERVRQLSRDISEAQNQLPLEAIALCRRVARRRVSAAANANLNDTVASSDINPIAASSDINLPVHPPPDHTKGPPSSFQQFLGSLWRALAIALIYTKGKATSMLVLMSVARSLGVSEWRSIRGVLKRTGTDKESEPWVANSHESQLPPGIEVEPSSAKTSHKIVSSRKRSESNPPENYFQLGGCEQEENESNGFVLEKKKKLWEAVYALKIGRGSITLAGGPIGGKAAHRGKSIGSRSNEGGFELESVLIPALHFSLKKLVLAYGATANASGASMACGSLKAKLLSIVPSEIPKGLAADFDAEEIQREFSSCGRWEAKVGDRASLLSSSPCPHPRNTGLESISDLPLAGGMYEKHWTWQDRQSEAWRASWPKPKPRGRDDSSRSQSPFPDSSSKGDSSLDRDNRDRPFLILEFNSLDGEDISDDFCPPGGLIKYGLSVGQLDFTLKSSHLPRVSLLLSQSTAAKAPPNGTYADTSKPKSQKQASPSSLKEYWNDNYIQYLDMCKEAMVTNISEKSILFSAVVDGPRVKVSAAATELHEYQNVGIRDTRKRTSNIDRKMGATVVLDFGRLEVAMWPPQKTMETTGVLLKEAEYEGATESLDWWDRAVDKKLWLRRPPAPALPEDSAQKRYWEHEQVGNNVFASLEGMALTLKLREETMKELRVIGPLGLTVETSLCWDQYTSLLNTSKSVSAAVTLKILSLNVQGYMHEVSVIQQVIDFYTDAFSKKFDSDPEMVVGGGDTSLAKDYPRQEEMGAVVDNNRRDVDDKCDSPVRRSSKEDFTVCALTFSAELEKLQLVVGSRHDDGGHTRSNLKNDAGLRYKPRGGQKPSFMINDDSDGENSWEQSVLGVDLGREAYIIVQDVLFHTSLGDKQQFCTFVGLKDILMRLVDSSKIKSKGKNALAEIRTHFFNTSASDRRFPSHLSGYRSFSGLTVAEVSLEYFSMKALGPGARQGERDEAESSNEGRIEAPPKESVSPGRRGDVHEGGLENSVSGPFQLAPQSSAELHADDSLQASDVRNSMASIVESISQWQPNNNEDQDSSSRGQQTPTQFQRANGVDSVKHEPKWLAVDMEVGKFLVTDGALDAFMARVALVSSGSDNLHLDFGIDSDFQKVSLGVQGGLILVHTAALAALSQFSADIGELTAKPTSPHQASEAAPRENSEYHRDGGGSGDIRNLPSLHSFNKTTSGPSRSSSVPVPVSNRRKKVKRTFSAPPRAQASPAQSSAVASTPKFGGVVYSIISGFSLVLAGEGTSNSSTSKNSSSKSAAGVLFEVDASTMFEVGSNARKSSFDLSRFTILGISAPDPGNSRKSPRRVGSRVPRFGASFKVASTTDLQGLSTQPSKKSNAQGLFDSEQTSNFPDEISETDTGSTTGRKEPPPIRTLSHRSLPDMMSEAKEEDVSGAGDTDSKASSFRPQRQASLGKQAEALQRNLTEFNSFILDHMSLHCAVERISEQDKVWKWTDAWQGQCSVVGFNLAITTSEIQLLESLAAPLSSDGGVSTSAQVESVPDNQPDEIKEDADEEDFEIPEGAVIAIKDVQEHCYLAAEEIPNGHEQFRLFGVLHYSLIGDKALFKVKYNDPSNRNSKTAWFSLLSVHAKQSDGESFRVHYSSGSVLAGISSTKDTPWEQWRLVPAESSQDDEGAVDIRNPAKKHLFHLINQKSKHSIAFEENIPVMVHEPGNRFKVKIISLPPESKAVASQKVPPQTDETPLPNPPLEDHVVAGLTTAIPQIVCSFDTFTFTILHEEADGSQLLPLLRLRVPGSEGVVQTGVTKSRIVLLCSVMLEYYETQSMQWVSIMNPVETEIFYRARNPVHGIVSTQKKTPVAFFSRLKKIEFIFSEPSLDGVLFLVGVLNLAGPYTVRYSPTSANRCLVDNQTGLDALCCFDQGSSKKDFARISSWHSKSLLMRHMTSRRDSSPAKVASTLELYLQQSGRGATSPVLVTLDDPGVIAVKTRLETDEGRKSSGPMVVVDVTRRNKDGMVVRVSPMIRIRNASGLPLELRCRRNVQEEGATVMLEEGDTIDDSVGAFNALDLEKEMKKALSSLNLGNYRLSIRPAAVPSSEDSSESEGSHEWSEDVKGAKPVRSAGLFDKLQYSFNKTVKAHNLESTFGVVFCPKKSSSSPNSRSRSVSSVSGEDEGHHFLIRTTCRQVPISRPRSASDPEQRGRYSVVAWQQQQELLLLPTVRVLNLMTSDISILLASVPEGRKRRSSSDTDDLHYNATVKSFGKECLYMDLGNLSLTVKHSDLELVSKPIGLDIGSKEFSQSTRAGNVRDVEMDVDFGDGVHTALVTVSRGEDGVLEITFLTRYSLQNDSHVTLLCCSSKEPTSRWGGLRSAKKQEPQWPTSGIIMTIAPKSKLSWFDRSTKILVKRTDTEAEPVLLDLESVSGSMEISLKVKGQDTVNNRIQLGVQLNVPSPGDSNSSCTILFVPRYIVVNDSGEAIVVCQDGFQEDSKAMVSLGHGERSALHAQVLPGQTDRKPSGNEEVGPEVLLTVRFRPKEAGWNWSGPVCAAAIGSFTVKIRRPQPEVPKGSSTPSAQQMDSQWFAVADVQEKESSLFMTFRRQSADAIPYRIENALRSGSISFNQEDLDNSESLEAGASTGYVWDDLGESHILTVNLTGSALHSDVNPDKLRAWKAFRTARRKKGLLQIPWLEDLNRMAMYGDENDDDDNHRTKEALPPVGYEVYADGPTRVVRVCAERDSKVDRRWQSDVSTPKMEMDVRIPLFTLSIVEPEKQSSEGEREETSSSEVLTYVPVISLRLTGVLIEALMTPLYTLCQIKAERVDVDVKWQGAPVAAMLRGHGQDRFAKGQTVLHMAVVISNLAKDPLQLKYASLLLQAMDLNIDEDTLMKLVPFYRYSLSESTESRQIYFERFEIHPIKIVGSFLPGKPRADYSSSQETLRALLHSVIKIPTVRGNTVELNGVLLSNALLTFKQLALKCAQHYSWYSMRAIYIARGSKMLPPGFASLFDDSAASSLDVFFDPSSGSVDLQGLTIGMFGVLSRGLRKGKGKGGTQRYIGDLQHTVKAAGSNLAFAVVTEVSDSVLKGADASGLDGLVGGFRRGILNVAMKPSVLRGAVVQGGSSRRIKLDRIVGTEEAYIEGYLQAMLDAVFKQNYLRVKVIDDLVILKNLPPNTTLMEEIIGCVRNFLIGEGLLAGESSAAALSSLRRLRGEDDRRLGPTVIALCQQLVVIIVVRSLRRQTIKLLHQNNITIIGDDPSSEKPEPPKPTTPEEEEPQKEDQRQGFFGGINFKRAVTGFALSSVLAYADGRLCRHIPNPLVRRIVSGFLLSFVE